MLTHTVTIDIDGGSDQVFYPGASIAGTVSYRARSGQRLIKVSIDLRGVTRVDPGKKSSDATEIVELFYMSEILHDEVVIISSERDYKWRFGFRFPTMSGPDKTGEYVDSGSNLFEEAPHLLPPRIDQSQSNEVKVEYTMNAVALEYFHDLWTMGEGDTRPVVCNVRNLHLRPDIEHWPEAPAHQLTQTLSLPETKKRRFSLRRSSATSITQANEDGPTFSVTAEIPSRLNIDGIATMMFSVQTDTDCPFTHKATTLRLESLTHRRTAKKRHDESYTEKKTTKLATVSGIGAVTLDLLIPVIFSTVSTKGMPPSFKSYNSARAYKLLSTIVLVCNRQEFEVKFEAPVELQYIASQQERLERRESNAPPPPPPPMSADFDEPLPDYAPREVRYRYA